jgi:hypothetical protein
LVTCNAQPLNRLPQPCNRYSGQGLLDTALNCLLDQPLGLSDTPGRVTLADFSLACLGRYALARRLADCLLDELVLVSGQALPQLRWN